MHPKPTIRRPSTLGLLFLSAALAVCPAVAKNLPVDLPDPDPAEKGVKDKPVKVYILSGQSNMLGFGRIEGAQPFYSSVFLAADPSVTEFKLPTDNTAVLRFGVFQSEKPDASSGGIAKVMSPSGPAKEQPIALGTADAKLPATDGSQTVVVDAFLEVPYDGLYHIHAGDDAGAIVIVDGKEAYRKEGSAAANLTEISLQKGKRHALKITYPTGGGSASLWLQKTDLKGMGDLRFVVNELGRFPHLVDADGNWTVRHDVMLNDAYMGKGASEPLSAAATGKSFGPELGFGYVMGEFHDEPVIVMKADIGNRSLGWDILPPGSTRYAFEGKEYPGYRETLDADGKVIPWDGGDGWYAGKQYDDYTASIRAVLDNFATKYPEYAAQGFEVAGFVWWQGHKDAGSAAHTARYEENLANLIRAWRKEFNAPNAKWAIATGCGSQGLEGNAKLVFQAQHNISDPARHPEFAGNVKTIETRPFWRDPSVSPQNQSYHYNHNAETYMLTGDALGRAMVELHGGQAEYPDPNMPDKVAALPMLDAPAPEALDKMRAALRPIVLGKILPDFVNNAPGVPSYLRRGLDLTSIVNNTPPAKPIASLASQLDKVVEYYQLVGIEDYQWRATGPEMRLAEWQYHTFDPAEKKADFEGDRYRSITLPTGMENWASIDFDAAKAGWKTGKAPFGQNNGKLAPLRARCGNPHCHCDTTPNTLWDKEVLLIRNTFQMPAFEDGKRYRLVVGGAGHVWEGEGFALYLNGEQVAEMKGGYYKSGGEPRGTFIFENLRPQVDGKNVTVAVKAFLRQNSHRNKQAPPTGHISVWLEEITLPPVLATKP